MAGMYEDFYGDSDFARMKMELWNATFNQLADPPEPLGSIGRWHMLNDEDARFLKDCGISTK